MPRAKKKQREPSPWEAYFISVVTDVFGFLVTEYGFTRGEQRRLGYEIYIEFARPPVAVEVGVGSDLPFTFVKHLLGGEWRSYNLSLLVPGPLDAYYADEPCVQFAFNPGTPEHCEAVRRRLEVDANLLRTYGQQFLHGDLSQLQGTD